MDVSKICSTVLARCPLYGAPRRATLGGPHDRDARDVGPNVRRGSEVNLTAPLMLSAASSGPEVGTLVDREPRDHLLASVPGFDLNVAGFGLDGLDSTKD